MTSYIMYMCIYLPNLYSTNPKSESKVPHKGIFDSVFYMPRRSYLVLGLSPLGS